MRWIPHHREEVLKALHQRRVLPELLAERITTAWNTRYSSETEQLERPRHSACRGQGRSFTSRYNGQRLATLTSSCGRDPLRSAARFDAPWTAARPGYKTWLSCQHHP